MAEKKILLFMQSSPHNTLNTYEGLRAAVGLWEHEIIIVWRNQGVYQLLQTADTQMIDQFFGELEGEAELYVDSADLAAGKITPDMIRKQITPIAPDQIGDLFTKVDMTFYF